MARLAGAMAPFAILAACGAAVAETPAPDPASAAAPAVPQAASTPTLQPPAADTQVTLAADTAVQIEILEEVSSANRQRGDMFRIRLAEPVVVDGRTVIPAGAEGQGQVTSAARPGMAGRAGELMIAARFVTHNGVRVPLRGLTVSGAGRRYGDQALVASTALSMVNPVLGLAAFAVRGGNIVIPAGTRANARLSAAVDMPPTGPSALAPGAASADLPAQGPTTPGLSTPSSSMPSSSTPASPVTEASP